MAPSNCPDAELQAIVAAAGAEPAGGIARLEPLIGRYPADPRLHFLYGSLLAGAQRYDEGIEAMARAVALNPGYVLARFQLGFLLLTCAKAEAAQQTWLPLLALPDDNPFRLFALGLGHLIRDEFVQTIDRLEAGMALNKDLPIVNNDMQLIVDEVRQILATKPAAPAEEGATSATQLLFERYAIHDTSAYKH